MPARLNPGFRHAPPLISTSRLLPRVAVTTQTQTRHLHLQEWESQRLLKRFKIIVLKGRRVESLSATKRFMKKLDVEPRRLQGRFQVEGIRETTHDALGYFREIMKQKNKSKNKNERRPVIPLYVEKAREYDTKCRLTMAVDREKCRPVIKIRTGDDYAEFPDADAFQKSFWFDLTEGISDEVFNDISQILWFDLTGDISDEVLPDNSQNPHLQYRHEKSLKLILHGLFEIFSKYEALSLEVDLLSLSNGQIYCSNSSFFFDDAARDRRPDIFGLRANDEEGKDEIEADETEAAEIKADEIEAEKHGLVYIRMDGDIGNVVNGAGLAMCTNDTIASYGGSSSNFLDAGGQATKETMLQAFKIILADKRVKAILVNIYGGITRCDMIAESIIAAASELGPLRVPVVARLQGTNSEAGLKLLEDANLGIHIEADFGGAARKVVELAKQQTQESVEKVQTESAEES